MIRMRRRFEFWGCHPAAEEGSAKSHGRHRPGMENAPQRGRTARRLEMRALNPPISTKSPNLRLQVSLSAHLAPMTHPVQQAVGRTTRDRWLPTRSNRAGRGFHRPTEPDDRGDDFFERRGDQNQLSARHWRVLPVICFSSSLTHRATRFAQATCQSAPVYRKPVLRPPKHHPCGGCTQSTACSRRGVTVSGTGRDS